MFSVSVGVLSKILDFDIFVRYESVNLNDYRAFSSFLHTHELNRASMHNGVSVSVRTKA